jgi:hypothetical protein
VETKAIEENDQAPTQSDKGWFTNKEAISKRRAMISRWRPLEGDGNKFMAKNTRRAKRGNNGEDK